MRTSSNPVQSAGRSGSGVGRLVALRGLGDRMRGALSVLRRIIGAPDYELYLRHHTSCHPDANPLSREDFTRQRLDARYSTPGNRCC
ncbi:MAG: YbdD/YjiX family protein [Gemmatimonadota bacterium]